MFCFLIIKPKFGYCQCNCKILKTQEVYKFLDTMPQFRQGNFEIYILNELTKSRFKDELSQFTFQIEMIIDVNGRPCNVIINKKNGMQLNSLERLIKRSIENMPDWQPGIKNGKFVNVFISRRIYLVG
jgi:hypothetical protein